MAIWAKHVREKFPQVDDRYPGSRRTARERQYVVRIGVPRRIFLTRPLGGASSARIHFGTVINDRSNSDQIRVPPICAIKKENLHYVGLLRLSRRSRGDIGLRRAEKV